MRAHEVGLKKHLECRRVTDEQYLRELWSNEVNGYDDSVSNTINIEDRTRIITGDTCCISRLPQRLFGCRGEEFALLSIIQFAFNENIRDAEEGKSL